MKDLTIRLNQSMTENDKHAIQNALDECSKNRGGTVILLSGRHHSLPLEMKSNTGLHLDPDAELIFSTNFSDYSTVLTRWEGTECHAVKSMIYAENSKNITITGEGIINGRGEPWWKAYLNIRKGIVSPAAGAVQRRLKALNKNINGDSGGGGIETGFLRPSLIQVKNCSNVLIEGITLKNSAFWNTHILYSQYVQLKNITFMNPPDAPNTDGLDIDSSVDIDIENCTFDVGDDCLCLKSGMGADGIKVGKSTSRVKITGCIMKKGHGAIVIGSETAGGIRDITISDCSIFGTDRGIRIKTRRGRGGTIRNIYIHDIQMKDVICPFVVNMYYRCGAKESEMEELRSTEKKKFKEGITPVIENITLENITAVKVKSSASFFLGLPESPVKNLTIRNFQIEPDQNSIAYEPAMDLFETKTERSEILISNVENFSYSNLEIDGLKDKIFKEIFSE